MTAPFGPATSVRSSVAASTSSTQLFAAGGFVNERIIYNESTAVLYLAYGAGPASTTDYTLQVAPGGLVSLEKYRGPVFGVWAAANGYARLTEVS